MSQMNLLNYQLLRTFKVFDNNKSNFIEIVYVVRLFSFWERKLCLFWFIFCTQKQFINRRLNRRFIKSEFFPHKNKHFYIFYFQNCAK